MAQIMSADEKMRETARLREKALHDEATALRGAREDGIEIGIKRGIKQGVRQGIKQGQAQMISAMCAFGISEEEIQKITSMKDKQE